MEKKKRKKAENRKDCVELMCELGGTPISITMVPEAACEYTKEWRD